MVQFNEICRDLFVGFAREEYQRSFVCLGSSSDHEIEAPHSTDSPSALDKIFENKPKANNTDIDDLLGTTTTSNKPPPEKKTEKKTLPFRFDQVEHYVISVAKVNPSSSAAKAGDDFNGAVLTGTEEKILTWLDDIYPAFKKHPHFQKRLECVVTSSLANNTRRRFL